MKNQIDFQIVGVFTNKTEKSWWPSLKDLENKFNIDVLLFDHISSYTFIKKYQPDYLLLLSWKHIINQNTLNIVKKATLNLHYSLLPKNRGVYPINWALYSGEKETGVTYHIVDNNIDSGQIVAQSKIEIKIYDDSKSLLEKLDSLALNLFKKIWINRSEWKHSTNQIEANSSYNSREKFEKSNCIDLNMEGTFYEFINILRSKSFGEYSHAYFYDEETNKKIKIKISLTIEDDTI
ncbi:MAG: formyltransferase family protein [Flavobacteriales bacterium]|nr:formyltransferase family protein [Flavobacteriales bacterium]MCW8937708.1 formyltransferase family protein [Flavobacteriales bacterium]MCW8968575.1 formyltransferase family protein [Flavobacteriales bacterium]